MTVTVNLQEQQEVRHLSKHVGDRQFK